MCVHNASPPEMMARATDGLQGHCNHSAVWKDQFEGTARRFKCLFGVRCLVGARVYPSDSVVYTSIYSCINTQCPLPAHDYRVGRLSNRCANIREPLFTKENFASSFSYLRSFQPKSQGHGLVSSPPLAITTIGHAAVVSCRGRGKLGCAG